MSVLACERQGCENIMCSRMLTHHGEQYYICDECFEELVSLGTVKVDVPAFFDTPKKFEPGPNSWEYWEKKCTNTF